MRQLATIQLVADVQPIENADAIEKIKVRDWWCVAKKGEFQVGSACVFFEIDSLLPSSHPAFDFLKDRSREVTILLDDGATASGYRLRTVRLRGQISQGLALSLDVFATALLVVEPEVGFPQVGDDVSELLGIHKWEPPISKQMAAMAFGPFPSFIPKTDEERVQNLGDTVRAHAGETFYATEKLDGSSVTMYKTNERFGVCSRNWDLLDGNIYWNAAREYLVEEKLPVGYAIQAEIIGEGIQGNPLRRKGHKLYVYNVYSILAGRYFDLDEMTNFCAEHSLDKVPLVSIIDLPGDVSGLVAMADGKSLLTPDADREGLVFRPLKEQREEMRGSQSRLSFKAISNRYLLKGDR
jgi:RNA ligase (TIGR02306 family)